MSRVLEGVTTVEDAGRQTRTFRHRAGKLIAVILTTVKAGAAAAEDMDDTNGNAPLRRRVVVAEPGILMPETTAAAGGSVTTTGMTVTTVEIQSLGAGAGLGRGIAAGAAIAVDLTPLPRTPGPRAHPHPPGPGLRTTLRDRALVHTLIGPPAGAVRALLPRHLERAAAETTETAAVAAAEPVRCLVLAEQGSATIVHLTDRMLIPGRSASVIGALAVGTRKGRPLPAPPSASDLFLQIGTRAAAASGTRTPTPRVKRFVMSPRHKQNLLREKLLREKIKQSHRNSDTNGATAEQEEGGGRSKE